IFAMTPAHLRTAPSRRSRAAAAAGRIAAQLERAAACGLFLEHLPGRLLRGTIAALVALLRRRAMQRAFLLDVGFGLRLLCFGSRLRSGLGRLRSFLGLALLLALAGGFAVLLFLELFLLALLHRLRLARLLLARRDLLRREVRRRCGGRRRRGRRRLHHRRRRDDFRL